jgi:hypothetical protein
MRRGDGIPDSGHGVQGMGKHESSISTEIVSQLQMAVPGPSRVKERRIEKRLTVPRWKVTFLGAEHEPVNWSLGGFLIADSHPHTPIGTITDGFLDINGLPGRFAIRIELVRRDKRTREIAFRFIDPSRAMLDAIARVAE